MHVRAGLWMQAIHGQSATTIWVWEHEKSNPRSDFAGDFMERASCAEAVGIANLDLNRAAEEVTAIQKAPAQALILHSPTAALWDGKKYETALIRSYTALSYTGVKPGFFTERQLEQGTIPQTRVVFVPNIKHLSDAAAETLLKYKGTLVFVNEPALMTANEYDQPANRAFAGKLMPLTADLAANIAHVSEQLSAVGIAPDISVTDATGHPQSSVQWQLAHMNDSIVMNLYNSSHDAKEITIQPPREMRDVSSNEIIPPGKPITLAPLQVRLLRTQGSR